MPGKFPAGIGNGYELQGLAKEVRVPTGEHEGAVRAEQVGNYANGLGAGYPPVEVRSTRVAM